MSIKVRTRQDGKIVFDVRVQYSGMRVARTVPTTATEAKRVESKILHDLIHGKYDILQNRKNPSFKQYAQEYQKSVTWQKSYRRTTQLIAHLINYFGGKKLTEITTQDFIDYRAMRLKQVSVATINREHSCLLRMLNLAIKNEELLINKNPLNGIKKFKEPPVENRILSIEEYRKLMDAAPEYFKRIMFFACNTGMRLMEILNLKYGQIRVWSGSAEVELIDTKSGDKEYVPLNEDVQDLLFVIAGECGVDFGNITTSDRGKYVFTGMRGQRLKSLRKPMEKTFREAGVELKPFHTFRHFWTKMMFEAGNDPFTIQKVGRWRDFKTMLKYCYTTQAQEHEAVKKLSERLKQKPAKIFKLWQYSGKI